VYWFLARSFLFSLSSKADTCMWMRQRWHTQSIHPSLHPAVFYIFVMHISTLSDCFLLSCCSNVHCQTSTRRARLTHTHAREKACKFLIQSGQRQFLKVKRILTMNSTLTCCTKPRQCVKKADVALQYAHKIPELRRAPHFRHT
jgi:hypothetical protein